MKTLNITSLETLAVETTMALALVEDDTMVGSKDTELI
jgi:hypothetical protein